VKKLFLVLLVLLVGIAGLSAVPLRPGGSDDAPLIFTPQEDTAIAFRAPGTPAPMWPAMTLVMARDHEAAFARAVELIGLWSDQHRQGLLTRDEFKTLVTGRIIITLRDYSTTSYLKADMGSMRFLAEKTRKNVDRLLMYRELELVIKRPISLAPVEYPLLC
jgi:hypothetical protein